MSVVMPDQMLPVSRTAKRPGGGDGTSEKFVPVRETQGEERSDTILNSALEVFSEFSFQDATTSEIARRARVSKRDLYALFPSKEALLKETVLREIGRQEGTFQLAVAQTEKLRSLRSKLDHLGITIVEDLLSPTMGMVRRLVVAEGLKQPFLGALFYERGMAARCSTITSLLEAHLAVRKPKTPSDLARLAERYFSMVAYLPSTLYEVGMKTHWTDAAIREHVTGETLAFLKAHPELA